MGNQGLKYAALAAVVVAVVLGILAYRMTVTAARVAKEQAKAELEAEQQAQGAQPSTLAVVALKPLAATRPIAEDDVALMPVSVVPERYFTQIENVVGRAPLIDVDVGAPVTPRYFRDSNILARIIPEGHQAMSLEISDIVAVGGFVRPGDEVDLLLFLRGTDTSTQARVLLEDVLVLAYEDKIIERPEGLSKQEGRPERRSRVRTAVVAVPEKETTKVMLAASVGEIRLALNRQTLEGEDALDNPTKDGGSPLPQLAQITPSPTPDAASREKTITLNELSRIAAKKRTRPRPRPYYIEVLRGSETERVRD